MVLEELYNLTSTFCFLSSLSLLLSIFIFLPLFLHLFFPFTSINSLELEPNKIVKQEAERQSPGRHKSVLPSKHYINGVERQCMHACFLSCSAVSDSSQSYGSTGSSVHGILQPRILEWVAILFSRGIFPTQGLNLDLLLCRRILYRLSHQEKP